uniref:Uncharacterized protein n=1 Tax=Panagrolaimus superbus TaxID=310955 RepID=A0A914Z5D3_9BILA
MFTIERLARGFVCYLFKENVKEPIWKSVENASADLIIPILHFDNGKYVGTSNKTISGYNLKKLPTKMDFFKCSRSHVFPVYDRIPSEAQPLMAAFMSYFLQTNGKNRSKSLSYLTERISTLLDLFGHDYKRMENPFMKYSQDYYIFALGEYVRKENGVILTCMEQFELFAKLINEKGYKADIYLYQEGHQNHVVKTNIHEFAPSVIPIITLADGRFAASAFNYLTFDVKNRLLRTEIHNIYKEKKLKSTE